MLVEVGADRRGPGDRLRSTRRFLVFLPLLALDMDFQGELVRIVDDSIGRRESAEARVG